MMKKSKFYRLFAGIMALAFMGCSHDNLTGNHPDEPNTSKDLVYMNVTVQLPTGAGSRSSTNTGGGSSDGEEVGKDYENEVKSILLVLAEKDNKFICCAEKAEGNPTSSSGNVTCVQTISKSVLSAYYGNDGTIDDNQVNVFVFCNPTDALRRIFAGVSKGDATWHEQICSLSETPTGNADNAAIWGGSDHKQGFLMSSYEIATKRLPTNFSDWDNFTTKALPFNLTGNNPKGITGGDGGGIDNGSPIKVERSVARFDFKDGSEQGNNKYNVIFDQVTPNPNCLVQIQLTKMALVNMSKSFYYLRRVSADGTDKDVTLCGIETSENYVVDTDAAEKANGSIISGNKYADHFNFCLGHIADGNQWTIDPIARDQWYNSEITTVLNGSADEDDGWNQGAAKGDYKIWRYVTENTIPGGPANQKHGISTGIVFKGKMVATDHDTTSELYKALTSTDPVSADNPILYAYGSDIYVRWTQVRAMAIKQGSISPMYKAVFGDTNVIPQVETSSITHEGAVYSDDDKSADYLWKKWFIDAGGKTEANLKAFKAAATKGLFTLYERSHDDKSGDGYYCYYYYWNRHNNNGKPAVMGAMEFGVVRNNVYKLAVTKINKLGHPRISENDPDPENPDNPDEDGDVYLSVSVQVLPWVVRINDIEF